MANDVRIWKNGSPHILSIKVLPLGKQSNNSSLKHITDT